MERATKIVVELLAAGTQQSEVAEITGNTPSAISQVATKYASSIAERQVDMSVGMGGHSTKLDGLETMLVNKLQAMIPLETDSMKVMNMFKTINGAARRDAGENPHATTSGGKQQVVVQLNLPQHMQQPVKVVTNPNNDVVSVDGRDLSPASISAVNKLANLSTGTGEMKDDSRKQALDDIMEAVMPANRMPAADAADSR